MQYVISYTETEVTVYACARQSDAAELLSRDDATDVRVRKLTDLSDIPTSVLVRLFNTTVEQPLTRFKDRATAESRVFAILPRVAAPYSGATATDVAPPVESAKVGVIATLKNLLERDSGVTVVEAVAHLREAFPDRKPEGMATTVRIQLGRLGKTLGRQVQVDVDERRGRVYRLK